MKLKELCNIVLGNAKYNHKYFSTNSGDYPVYSSQTSNNGVIAKINDADLKNKTGITWTKDGIYAGTVFKRINDSFSMTTHCGFLEIKEEHKNNILYDFLFFWLSFNLKKFAIGEQNKRVTEDIIKQIDIPFYGNLLAQNEFIEKYAKIYELISLAKDTVKTLTDIKSDSSLEHNFELKEYPISEIIKIGKSNSGFLTQKFVNDNKGTIPVYGASEKDAPSYGFISDNVDKVNYFNDCFRYNRNGSFGVFITKGRFTISNDVRAFTLQDEYIGKIDPEYLIIKLKEVYYENSLGYSNKAGKDRFLSLNVKLIDLNIYKIENQKEIAQKYNLIVGLKEKLIKNLESIV